MCHAHAAATWHLKSSRRQAWANSRSTFAPSFRPYACANPLRPCALLPASCRRLRQQPPGHLVQVHRHPLWAQQRHGLNRRLHLHLSHWPGQDAPPRFFAPAEILCPCPELLPLPSARGCDALASCCAGDLRRQRRRALHTAHSAGSFAGTPWDFWVAPWRRAAMPKFGCRAPS